MLQAFVAGQVPVELSRIVVDGPVLDSPMTLQVYACAYGEAPTYQAFQTDDRLAVDVNAFRQEVAGCRIPDRINVAHTPSQAEQGLAQAARVSRHLDVPMGFYAKGYYNNSQKTRVRVLMFMGVIPVVAFLGELKRVIRG
jgi:hypothetical protein